MNYMMADFDDIQELTRMRIAYIKDDQGNINEQEEMIMRKKLPEFFSYHLGKDLLAFVAKDNDVIIATAFLLLIQKPSNPHFINGLTGEVLNVYTTPSYRRRGIAENLMDDLINYSKKHNLDFIELESTKDGYHLYEKLGFKEYHSGYTEMRLTV